MSEAQVDRPDEETTTSHADTNGRIAGIPLPYTIAGVTILAFLILWEILAHVAYSDLQLVFPSLYQIGTALVNLLLQPEFYHHLWVSAQEILLSFALASVIGITLGSIVGSSRFLANAVEPILYYFSTVPKIILYPMFIAMFGASGMESKIAVGFLSALFPITVNAIAGTLNVRTDLVKVAKINGASFLQIFTKVYLPSIITNIVNGLRLGIAVAILATLFAELFASQAGLGNRIAFYFSNLYVARMYAVLIFVFITSFVLNLTILGVQHVLGNRGYGMGDSEGTFGF